MKQVTTNISIEELRKMTERMHDQLVKAVVDIDRGVMLVDMEMHSDGEFALLENGSQQENLWGINIHPFKDKENWIEFDAMINIRPSQGNRSRSVEREQLRSAITSLVHTLVTP